MPARSPRRYYKIPEITVERVQGGSTVSEPVIVKMKESHAQLLGLSPISAEDEIWEGTFGTGGSNAGKKYLRNLGGFRQASYKIRARDKFNLTVRQADGTGTENQEFKEISIGFPKGHSMLEVVQWLASKSVSAQIDAVISPAGRAFYFDAE